MSVSATRGLFRQPEMPLLLETVSVPLPQVGEAIVEIELCTICGSDLHTIEGRRSASGSQVLGHEIIGRIAHLPATERLLDFASNELRLGDRVTWSIHASCGECFWCRHRLSQKCERLFKYGHATVTQDYPVTGGMATHCQLRAGTAILRVPERMDARLACPVNCATATVAATYRQLESCEGKCILILGAGMLGLTAAVWARAHGADKVVVFDPQAQRAALAKQFAASHASHLAEEAKAFLDDSTSGRGADAVLDFSGHPTAVRTSLEWVRTGGHVIWVGSVFPSEPLRVDPENVVRRCLQISGVHNYLGDDLAAALQFLEQFGDRYPLADLVSATFGLSEVNQAVQHALSGQAVRVAIDPQR